MADKYANLPTRQETSSYLRDFSEVTSDYEASSASSEMVPSESDKITFEESDVSLGGSVWNTTNPTLQNDAHSQDPESFVAAYSVGLICALQTEYKAVCRMLDEEFTAPETVGINDHNTYVFGRIGGHYVVVGCLPKGRTNNNNAASVASHMVRSFQNLKFALMVGIGGGAPTKKNDIRLGDIVVSVPEGPHPGVVQYDFVKRLHDGKIERTGQLNAPPNLLLSVIQELDRRHTDSRKSDTIAMHIKRMNDMTDYQRPSRDHLYRSNYVHVVRNSAQNEQDEAEYEDEDEDEDEEMDEGGCQYCEAAGLRKRRERPSFREVMVHYGTIASGNSLMKDVKERNKYAQELNIMCFEMEAAGLMNNLPCLVIRGICDYSDSHKNDDWQKYAALTAAAYARDLLLLLKPQKVSVLPSWVTEMQQLEGKLDVIQEKLDASAYQQKEKSDQELLDWLAPINFSSSRHNAIRANRVLGTGNWILEHSDFTEWRSGLSKSRVLCCFGGPGAGKTYMASYVIDTLTNDRQTSEHKIGLAYVYCDYKDKSRELQQLITVLVRQLLSSGVKIPSGIVDIYNQLRKSGNKVSVDQAMNMLLLVCAKLDRTYICIDAVDEFDDREKLLEVLKKTPTSVHIFITGRDHVEPLIKSQFEEAIVLPLQASKGDVISLIKNKVMENLAKEPDLMTSEFQDEITEKIVQWCAGNFLLASYQIQFVLEADTIEDRRENLTKLPITTGEAFIVTIERMQRQSQSKARRGMQILNWVYLTEQPLSVDELIHALATKKEHQDVQRDNFVSKNTFLDNCLGLVTLDEQTSTIRLVHKSLQDFLDAQGELFKTEPHKIQQACLQDIFKNGQKEIGQTCLTYLMFLSVTTCSEIMANEGKKVMDQSNDLPLIGYAACQWGHHLRKSFQMEEDMIELSKKYLSLGAQKRYWSQWYLCDHIKEQSFESVTDKFISSFSEMHIMAYFGLHSILATTPLWDSEINFKDIKYGRTPLSWAAQNGHQAISQLLIERGAAVYMKDKRGRTSLLWAAGNGHQKLVELFIQQDASVDSVNESGETPLFWAAQNGHLAVVELLITEGASVNSKDNSGQTPLLRAAEFGNLRVVELLIENGAVVDAADAIFGQTPLSRAAENGHLDVVKLLIEKNAGIESKDTKWGRTPLAWAALHMHGKVVKFLAKNGALVDSVDADHQSPLLMTALKGHKAMVELLIEEGASLTSESALTSGVLAKLPHFGHEDMVKLMIRKGAEVNNDMSEHGNDLLAWASRYGMCDTVRLLIEKGARVDSRDRDYGCMPLLWAACNGHQAVMEVLLENGASIDLVFQTAKRLPPSVSQSGNVETVRLMIRKGAEAYNQASANDTTLISWASRYECTDAMELLFDKGASVDSVDEQEECMLLSWAARNGSLTIVELLIRRGASMDAVDKRSGQTPLSWATRNGHQRVVKFLIEEGALVNTIDTSYGRTPLFWAVMNHHEAIARLLIENGALADQSDYFGHTPLIWAAQNGHQGLVQLLIKKKASVKSVVSWAARNGHRRVMEVLIREGGDINRKDRVNGQTPLSQAAANGHLSAVELLIERRAEIDTIDSLYGQTPLSWAAKNGHQTVVELLIKKGASIDLRDRSGRTPLSWAARHGNEATLIPLIEAGASVDAADNFGQTPLSWAAEKGHPAVVRILMEEGALVDSVDIEYDRTPLVWAVLHQHEAVVKLLVKKGASVDIVDKYGLSPLSWAAKYGYYPLLKILINTGAEAYNKSYGDGASLLSWASRYGYKTEVKSLIEKEASVNSVDPESGHTSLWWAIENEHPAVVKLLIEEGAWVDLADEAGRNSLSWAARKGNEAIVALLIRKGASISSVDKSGQTPLSWAFKYGHEVVIKLLIEKGAEVYTKASGHGATLMSWASRYGHKVAVESLIEKGAVLDSVDTEYCWTPLIWAAKHGKQAVLKLLLDRGATVDLADQSGRTPLSWATMKGHEATAKYLIERGALVDYEDKYGWKPLSLAARKGHEGVVKLLIEQEASIDSADKSGRTAFAWAAKNRQQAVINILIEKGAKIDTA